MIAGKPTRAFCSATPSGGMGNDHAVGRHSPINIRIVHARIHFARIGTPTERNVMKTHYPVTLAMLVGFGLGAVAVQGLHAQAKPPVYQITEIDVLNQEAYLKDYAPKAQAAIKAAGGKFLAAGGKTTTIEGEPPKSRVVLQQWDSVEKI